MRKYIYRCVDELAKKYFFEDGLFSDLNQSNSSYTNPISIPSANTHSNNNNLSSFTPSSVSSSFISSFSCPSLPLLASPGVSNFIHQKSNRNISLRSSKTRSRTTSPSITVDSFQNNNNGKLL